MAHDAIRRFRWLNLVATVWLVVDVGSASAVSDTKDIRGLAASGFYTESIARARQVLADASSRAPESAEEARALDLNLEVLSGSGLEYTDDARALVQRALELKARLWGREHPEYARTLMLAARLRRTEAPGAVRDMLELAQSIQERSLPKDDPNLAETHYELFSLGSSCRNPDRNRFLRKLLDAPRSMEDLSDPATVPRRVSYAAAEDRARCEERLSELVEEIGREYGPDHPLAARAIYNLALCQGEHGRVDRERAGLEQALAALRAAFGPTHVEVGDVSIALASVVSGGMESRRAEFYYLQGIEAYTGVAGRNSPLLREPLLAYASYLSATERFDEAFAMATKAMALGPSGFDVHCPTDLARVAWYAILLRDHGDWAEAKALLEPIVEQSGLASIGDSEPYADVLDSFGDILLTLGDDYRARDLLERSLAMRERISGRAYISDWVVLANLGAVLARLGELDAADAHLEHALQILTRHVGPTHGCISTVLMLVADVQVRRGDLAGAKDTLLRALTIADATFGDTGGRTSQILRGLCSLEESIGDLGQDRSICARALSATERRYGPYHPEVTQLLGIEAALSQASGDRKTALRLAIDAEQRSRAHFTSTIRTLSEREALSFGLVRHTALDVALTVLATGTEEPRGTDVRRVWNEVLRSRAIVLDESIARRRALSGNDPEARRLFERLETARGGLSRAVLRSMEVADPVKSRAEIDAAVAGVDAAERSWSARRVARDGNSRTRAGIDQVLAAVPRDAALVAYVRYVRLDRSRPGGGTLEYAALIAPSRSGPVEFVRLGDAESIDRMVADWSREVGSEPTPGLSRSAESSYRTTATPLREAIWDPVRARLGSPSLVLLVPEGPLHLVAFGTLPAGEDRYLVETDPPIQLLSTERDVVALPRKALSPGGLLAVGNPAFDSAQELVASASTFRGARGCASFRSLEFAPLSQAITEVEEVRRTWLQKHSEPSEPAVVLLGDAATEQAFKRQAPSSRVIHLATHGFVLPPDCTSSARGPAAAADSSWLTLAGLAFAGANRRDESRSSESDGILTTEELATLDLTRTDWVVLSACDSGLGSVLQGEGVFGLRRALEIAGARTTIMSLWEVRDDAARDFMGRLYRARMDGESTVSAVRSASLGTLMSRRSHGQDTHPARWGAFVAVGDWR